MPIYRPRMQAVLTVPKYAATREKAEQIGGKDTVELDIRVSRAQLVRNDHHNADVLHISSEWYDSGVDPRFLKHATCEFSFSEESEDQPRTEFIGIVKNVNREAKEGGGFAVDLEVHDYTTLFLESRPYPSDGVPLFNDTLRVAWEKICRHTGYKSSNTGAYVSSVEALIPGLTGKPEYLDTPIQAAVSERLGKLGKFIGDINKSTSSWDMWQHAIFALGFISYIDGTKCIVTTAEDFYNGPNKAPKFIWGLNVAAMKECCNADIANRGVAVQSWDPIHHKVLEAYYPEPGDSRIYVKRAAAKSKHFNPQDVVSSEYDFFENHEVTNLDQLKAVAKAAYEERSRQEFEGTITTHEMNVYTDEGESQGLVPIDILDIRAGETIRVLISDTDREFLKNRFTDESQRRAYLINAGYSTDMINLIMSNLDNVSALNTDYHVKQAVIELSDETFKIDITYHNLIDLSRVAADRAPAIGTAENPQVVDIP